jgi:hypothetical protein
MRKGPTKDGREASKLIAQVLEAAGAAKRGTRARETSVLTLTVVAILNGTGKFKDFPIQQGSCKSLTAIAAPNWVE